MKAQAVVFDLDGTLLRDDKSISAYTLEVLHRAAAAGVHVIPASGRAQISMAPAMSKLRDCASCYIACNGAEIWSADDQLLHQETLPVALAKEIARFALEHHCHAQVYYGDRFYYHGSDEKARAYEQSSSMQGVPVEDLVAFIDRPICKFLMIDTREHIAALNQLAAERFAGRAAVSRSSSVYLEVNPLLASKGLALETAARLLGFDVAHTVAFGDGFNDMSMLTAAGTGVVMANAWPEMKAMVPVHCASNMDDGVAHFIEENILKEANA